MTTTTTNYEVLRRGCAVDSHGCPHGEHAITVYQLDANGRRKYGDGMTLCVDGRTLERDVWPDFRAVHRPPSA